MSLVISLDSQLTLVKDAHLIFGVVFFAHPLPNVTCRHSKYPLYIYIHTSIEFAESIFHPALAGPNYWIASDPKNDYCGKSNPKPSPISPEMAGFAPSQIRC